MHKSPQQTLKQQYGRLELMDLSGTRETQKGKGGNKLWKPKNKGYNGQKLQEQRPNQRSQQKKTFEQTPQQQQQFKKGACINYKQQSHFAKDCKMQTSGIVTNQLKGTQKPQNTKELKRIKEYVLKHFAFCYDDKCPVYKETKYGASYQPQEPELEQLKGIKKMDRLQEWETSKRKDTRSVEKQLATE